MWQLRKLLIIVQEVIQQASPALFLKQLIFLALLLFFLLTHQHEHEKKPDKKHRAHAIQVYSHRRIESILSNFWIF